MEPQKYPYTVIKKGAVLYEAVPEIVGDKTKITFFFWVVRTIQKHRGAESDRRYVNLAVKLPSTWGKRSGKAGDYGWAKSIPSLFRKQFAVGGRLPFGLFTTKLAALKWEVNQCQEEISYLEGDIKSLPPNEHEQARVDLEEQVRLLTALRAAVKREQIRSR